jgi:hypothetical protein
VTGSPGSPELWSVLSKGSWLVVNGSCTLQSSKILSTVNVAVSAAVKGSLLYYYNFIFTSNHNLVGVGNVDAHFRLGLAQLERVILEINRLKNDPRHLQYATPDNILSSYYGSHQTVRSLEICTGQCCAGGLATVRPSKLVLTDRYEVNGKSFLCPQNVPLALLPSSRDTSRVHQRMCRSRA